MSTFAIAALQLALEQKDNLSEIADEVRRLKRRFPWVRMVLIGELAAYGADLTKAQPMPGPTEGFFADLAKETEFWLIPGSLYEQRGAEIYNTSPVIDPSGKVIARYSKMYPFTPYERGMSRRAISRWCSTCRARDASASPSATTCGLRKRRARCAWMGAEVILHPSMTNTIDRDVELSIARASAATNQCYFLDINVAGKLGYGRSIVAGPGGEVIHQCGDGREIVPVEIDFTYVRRVRETGWHGLGQPLKSFRDGGREFAPYDAQQRSESLDRLGPLVRPGDPPPAPGGNIEPLRKKQ